MSSTAMSFASLNLVTPLQQAIDLCGYTQMTPIQEKAINIALEGKDILACAQTGTGKTAAFAIPILQQLLAAPRILSDGRKPRALILTPTRELAEQLAQTIGEYAQCSELNVLAIYGGAKVSSQKNKLARGCDILIATPGRMLEQLRLCNVDLADVQSLVLDEADRMLDMGFVSDVLAIWQQAKNRRQALLFSATLSAQVNELAHKILSKPIEIRINRQNTTADTVSQVVYEIDERRKIELFEALLEEHNWFQVLVFTSTKAQANELLDNLRVNKIDTAICHGDRTQGSRRRAISDFKSGKIQVLIATEVAARGLDIENLEYVVNFNLPFLAEDYVHRIGRTGRAGKTGTAISFVSREEERSLENIERLIGHRIKRARRPGFEVGSRSTLLKTLHKKKPSGRSNKTSQNQNTAKKALRVLVKSSKKPTKNMRKKK